MKNSMLTLVLALIFGASTFAQTMTVDASKAVVSFNVPAEKTTGTLTGLEAKIVFDPSNLASSTIKGSIPVSTITTGSKMRDKHILNDEFFNAAKYPKMSFSSTSITKTEKGYTMTGQLTIKAITKDVKINFTFENNVFVGKLIVYTNDFDINVQKDKEDSKVLVKLTVPVK